MAAIMTPPGLSLPTEEEVRAMKPPPGLELFQELRAPPGFAPIEHGKKVSPPPGLTKIPEDGQVEEVQPPKTIFSIADSLGIKDDDPLPAPCRVVPVVPPRPHVPGVSGYRELQKTFFEKEKLEKKVQRLQALERLEAMVTCVEELGAIQKKVDAIDASAKKKADEKQEPQRVLWTKKESKSHAGKFYYVHSETGKTTWTKPADYVEPKEVIAVKTTEKKPKEMGLSDFDGSTDAGSSSDDYDSDTVTRSVSSRTSSHSPVSSFSVYSVDAPVFKPGFRADAPEFTPSGVSA